MYKRAILIASLFVPPHAIAQSSQDIVRSISAIAVMKEMCPAFYRIDDQLIDRMISAYREIGHKIDGTERFERALSVELQRRNKEVQFQTTADWCKFKKTEFMAAGFDKFFK